ncbi:sugar-transfer associated ATP-grasp domain-containing protein [Algoriphagus sediminis]|uniref:Sugar-transfer associated ATP-grasp domain-containing protein n=1 Tax=Algoriphagus sediminis TaxID=3057113 RepID=A0ABT7YGF3_9BACT|nr:sugar-transfer associated ATP-grasp domain-containing protein [Algoriphagus sediminis]MDN3205606.1 sugar-transfer associated ATP-grasp domain-containing protein [Algoriphagus sediminis]
MGSIFSSFKSQVKKFSEDRYYQKKGLEHLAVAEKAIFSILKTLPRHRLSTQTERLIESYAKEKLGSIKQAPYLKAYAVFQGEFKEGWIPDNYFERYVLPRTNGFHRTISDLRQLAKRILRSDEMPDLGYFVRGSWTTVEGIPMAKNQIKDYFFSSATEVIVKLNGSMRGVGFFRLNAEEFSKLREHELTDFVVQLPIRQHAWFSRFTMESVATLRITTVKPYGKPAKKMAAFMRFGRDGVDRITATSRLVVGVTAEGYLVKYSIDSNWELLTEHPDSGILWESNQIPDFDRMVKRCEELHDQEGTMEILAWDLILDEENKIQIMEWNTGYPGIVHSEMTTGPNFLETDWSDLWKNQKRIRHE